jgi:hypothetical protein
MRRLRHLMLPLLAAALLSAGAAAMAQNRVDQRAAQFDRESDPVRKARAFPNYGNELLKLLREQLKAESFAPALATLERYRDNAAVAHKALKESGINAERKSNGFRQLQIHLRQGARQIEEAARNAPFQDREQYETIRRQIEQFDRELINMLFPRQPGKRP